jgi:hypothetical protein
LYFYNRITGVWYFIRRESLIYLKVLEIEEHYAGSFSGLVKASWWTTSHSSKGSKRHHLMKKGDIEKGQANCSLITYFHGN